MKTKKLSAKIDHIDNWLGSQNQIYLNNVNLTPRERHQYETKIYSFKENKAIDADYMAERLLWSDPELDAYQAALREEAEVVYERNLALFHRAAAQLTQHQQYLIKEFFSGRTFTEIAKNLGVDKSTISQAFHGHVKSDGQRVSGIIKAIKVEIDRMRLADQIIALKARGLSNRAIGKQLGTSHKLVGTYLKRYGPKT